MNYAIKLIMRLFIIFIFLATAMLRAENTFSMKVDKINQEAKKKVTGVVYDELNEPLPGVSILVQGSSRGVMTDNDGTFSIEVLSTNKLIVSFVGYTTQTVEIGAKDKFVIKMVVLPNELDEVTITAMGGYQRKESVVGAISSINPTELKVPSSNLTTAFAGRIAGLVAYQRSGEPGADNVDFFIRGITTFGTGKVDPLILIDNIEVTSTELARLQPDDIESFSIMKDATATALYGARGANGVVFVTTKQGKEGKVHVNLRLEQSITRNIQDIEMADPVTYMRMANEAVLTRDPLGVVKYSDRKIDQTAAGANPSLYPTVDWLHSLMKSYAPTQRVNLSVSGGGKVARYYVAASWNKSAGNLRVPHESNFNNNIDLQSYTLRSNVNINITPSTEMVVRLSGVFDDYNGPIDGGTDIYNKIMKSNPVMFPPYYEKDEAHKYIKHIMFGNAESGNYLNPYADMVKGMKEYSRSIMRAQLELKQKLDFITKGLSARILFSATRNSYYDFTRAYKPFYYEMTFNELSEQYSLNPLNPDDGTEYIQYSPGKKDVSADMYTEIGANYIRDFGKHSVNSMLVFQVKNIVTGNAEGDNAALQLENSLPRRNVGLSGRATYGYDSRYFAEFNFGYTATERFALKNRWGFFPSVGLGWILSNEHFYPESWKTIVQKLKLKASFGLVGNDDIGKGRFLYLSVVDMNSRQKATFGTNFGYTNSKGGISVTRYGNDAITWESGKKANLGLEATLFNDFRLEAEVYTERRNNILMDRASIPATMGLESMPQANVGKAESKGFDLSINYNKSINKNWWAQGRVNFTYATSKCIVYEEPVYKDSPLRSRVGYPLNQTWGYIAERLFIDDADVKNSPLQNFGEYGPGDIKYRDVNGDGQITDLDKVPIGFPTSPEIVYGFGFSLGYKNIDFSCFFQGVGRESFWISPKATAPFVGNNQLLKVYADSYWSEENRDIYALWPRLSMKTLENNTQVSTWFMQNGTFLRLKSLEIGYSLPERIKKRLGGANVRVYANGTNLLTFSKFKLWDPEMAGNGLGYPIQQVFNLGLNITF